MHLKSEMEKRNKIAQSQVLELRSTDDRSSNKWGRNICDKFDLAKGKFLTSAHTRQSVIH